MMKNTTRESLKNLKENTLPPLDTEGVENALTQAAMEAADRKKWATMLAEDGIEREKAPMQVVSSVKKSSQTLRYILAIAAVGLVAVAGFWFSRSSTSDAFSVDDYLAQNRFADPETDRGGTADPKDIWEQAKVAYRQKNDAEVVRLLGSLTKLTDEQLFYLSFARLNIRPNEAAKAATGFEQLISKKSDFEEESRWYLSLCYIKLDKAAAAKPLLTDIVAQKKWNHVLAEQLLRNFRLFN